MKVISSMHLDIYFVWFQVCLCDKLLMVECGHIGASLLPMALAFNSSFFLIIIFMVYKKYVFFCHASYEVWYPNRKSRILIQIRTRIRKYPEKLFEFKSGGQYSDSYIIRIRKKLDLCCFYQKIILMCVFKYNFVVFKILNLYDMSTKYSQLYRHQKNLREIFYLIKNICM